MPPYVPIAIRFEKKVNRTPAARGCHEWTGATTHGYGRLWDGRIMEGAHRVSWAVTVGPIPDGMHVLHHCDNRLCVNVAHLYLGTDVENAADRVRRDRQSRGMPHAQPGESNKNSKLTAEEVMEIRALYAHPSGEWSQRKLAKRFSVTQPQIGYIVRREQWAHI